MFVYLLLKLLSLFAENIGKTLYAVNVVTFWAT